MKYVTLTSPTLAMYSIFSPTVIFLLPLIFSFLSINGRFISNLMMILLVHFLMNIILVLIFRNAFQLVFCSKYGIKNKHINLKWEDINYVTTTTIELFKWSILPTIDIDLICISQKETTCSFWNITQKEYILLPLNKKNLNMLSIYSNSRSAVLSEFILRYNR